MNFEICRGKPVIFSISPSCFVLKIISLSCFDSPLCCLPFPSFLLAFRGIGSSCFCLLHSLCGCHFPSPSLYPFPALLCSTTLFMPITATVSALPVFVWGSFFFVFLCSSVCGFLLVQVDKHIRRLDADLARFEADLKDKLEGSDFETPGSRSLKSG